jgi:hypothetical protein
LYYVRPSILVFNRDMYRMNKKVVGVFVRFRAVGLGVIVRAHMV